MEKQSTKRRHGDAASSIELIDISKSFGPVKANKDISMKISQGTIHGIIGENGAGKSTFLKTILGLIQTTEGEGSVLGLDIRTQGDEIRSRIGYMPEYDSLNPEMEAIHQVRYSGELLGMNPSTFNTLSAVPASIKEKANK